MILKNFTLVKVNSVMENNTTKVQTVRIGTDITIRARLVDSGIAVDFASSPPVSVGLVSLAQNVLIRDVETMVDPEDGSVLVILWKAADQCYLGQYNLVVSATLSGRTATFEAPAFELVRLLGQRQAESDQPDTGISDIAITLEVESIDSSLISQLIQDCKDAASSAFKAASDAANTNSIVQQAETLRVEAETARKDAEDTRKENEAIRQAAEKKRISDEDARQSAETLRESAEIRRVSAEDARIKAEDGRSEAEQGRVDAEAARAAAEKTRAQAEDGRISAENARIKAENLRVAAEIEREQDEQSRQEASEAAVADALAAAQIASSAAQVANAAAELANQNVLAILFDPATGTLSALYGTDGSAFENGEINEKGEIVLEFNYQ